MGSDMIKVGMADIAIGRPLSWALYDRSGRLVLDRGIMVRTEGQLSAWIEKGVFRKHVIHTRETGGTASGHIGKPEPYFPFPHLDEIQARLEKAFVLLNEPGGKGVALIDKLADEVATLCGKAPDPAIGFIHLGEDYRYTVRQPVKKAIICELIARKLKLDKGRRQTLLKAALTCDIAMLELQERLQQQDTPLTPVQKSTLHNHPQASVNRLQQAGVTDRAWLEAVLQHHELCDGSGYPAGLQPGQIGHLAKIVSLADAYCAMVSAKAYREKMDSRDALKDFFHAKGKQRDETLSLVLIKELTAFPPGTVVELASGEIAVVTRRTDNPAHPVVSAIISPGGDMYLKPYRRDTARVDHAIRRLTALPPHARIDLQHAWEARVQV